MSTTITAGLRIDTSAAYKDIDVFKSRINKSFSQPLGRISGDAAEFSKSLQAAAARVTAFGATTGSIYLVTKAISETARATIEVNKQLTELNTFLGESESSLQNFSKTLFSIARNTGSTFSDATEAAKEFARQGLSTEETLNRTNDALILSRISGLNYAQSVNSITTALNGFGKEALTSTDIINKLIAVDTRFAVSSKDLSEALTRVGSAAEEAGLSSDQLVATITTAQQITGRGGAVIGNALKTIFTRVRRPEILDQLKQIGVVVTDQNGSLLNAIDILKNYTNVTKNLSQAEKSRTAELLGGVYQINQLQSVIRDLGSANSIYASSLKISIGATDEAIKKNSELNKSYAALINDTANLATQVGSDIGKSLFGPIISGGAGVTKKILEFLSPESILPQIGKTGQEIGKSLSREIGKGVLDTLGNALVFVGAPIAAVVGASIGSRLIKFLTASVQTQIKGITDPLGRVATGGSYSGNKEREQLNLQNQISDIVKKNNFIGEATVKGVYNEGKARREVLKEILSANIQLERQANLAQTIFNTISKIKPTVTTIGQVNSFGLSQVNPRRNSKGRFIASGYIPNFSMGLAEQEESAAKGFGAKNPKARLIRATIKGKTGPVMINDEEDVVPNFAGTGETAIIPRYRNVKDIPRMAEGYVPNFAQKISSAGTSQNQVPGLFTKFGGEIGPRNIDIGGGKYNKGTNFLKKKFGTFSRVHDKYNRSAEFNDETLKELYGSADTATVANVLNVIEEKSAREELLEFVSKSIKPTGSAYFSIYEKDKTGIGAITPRGYQNNLPTDAYLEEISKYFNITKKTGNYIVGSPISKASGYIPNFNHAKGRLPEGISGSMATFYDLNRKFGNLNIGKKVFKEQFPEDIKKQAIAREFLAARELLNLERSGLVSPIWKSPELIGTLQRSLERKSIGKEAMVGYKTQADLVDSLPNEFARNNLRSLFRLTNASLYDQVSTSQIGVRDLNPHNVMVNPQGQKIFTDIASSENFSKHQGKILFSQNSDSKANLLLRRIARRGARLSVVDPGEFSLESPALSREFAESLRDGRASGYIPNFAKKDKYKFPNISSNKMEANISKNFEKLTPENQRYFARAYEDYNNLIKVFSKASGASPEKFASVMSALSPANPLERNALDALRYNLFYQKKLSTAASPIFIDEREIGSVKAQTYGANRTKAANLLVGLEKLTGNKRKSFVNNMLDPFQSTDVTVDYRAQGDALNKQFNVKNAPSMNREQYDKVSQAFRNVGSKAGVSGLGVQAATWIGGRIGSKAARGQDFNRGILKFFYDNPDKISLENLEFLLSVPGKGKARKDFFKKASAMGVSKLGSDSLISISRAGGYVPNFAEGSGSLSKLSFLAKNAGKFSTLISPVQVAKLMMGKASITDVFRPLVPLMKEPTKYIKSSSDLQAAKSILSTLYSNDILRDQGAKFLSSIIEETNFNSRSTSARAETAVEIGETDSNTDYLKYRLFGGKKNLKQFNKEQVKGKGLDGPELLAENRDGTYRFRESHPRGKSEIAEVIESAKTLFTENRTFDPSEKILEPKGKGGKFLGVSFKMGRYIGDLGRSRKAVRYQDTWDVDLHQNEIELLDGYLSGKQSKDQVDKTLGDLHYSQNYSGDTNSLILRDLVSTISNPLTLKGIARIPKDKRFSEGYIPNFAGLSDAISREQTMTGLPVSKIMAHFDGKGKPIAVTNKKDEPNGLKDVVPNFAPRVRPPKAPKGSKKTTAAQGSDLFNSFFNELIGTGLFQSFLSTLTDREVLSEDANTVAQTALPAVVAALQAGRGFKASKGQKAGARVVATGVPIALGAAAAGIGFAGSRSISEDLQRRKLEKESDRAAKEFKDLTEGTQELADTLSKLNESFKDASTSPEQLSSLSKRASELTRNLTKNNPGLAASISSESNVEKKINLIEDARRKASQQQAVKQEIIQFEGSKTKSPEDLINLFSKEISLANDKLLQLNSKDLVPANFDKILSDADLGPLKTFFDLQKQEVKNKLIPSFLEAVKFEIEYTKINKESVKKIKALRAEEFKASSEIEGKQLRRKAASDALASGAEELKPFASQFGSRAAISFDSDLQKTKESISAITSFRTQINTKLIDKDLKLPSNVTAKLQGIQTPGQDAGAVLAELSKTPGLNEKQIEALDELITTNQTQSKELKKISDISEINKNAQLRVLSIQEKLTYGGGIKTSTDARSRIDSINAPIKGLLESRLGATLGSERSQTSGMVNVLKSIKDLYPGLIENSKALGSVRDRLTNLRANDLRKDLFRNASLLESAGGYGDIPGMLRAKGLDSEGLKTLAATQAEAELSGGNSPQETTRYLADVIKAATDNLNATMREGQEIKALQEKTAGPVEKINQETEVARQKFLTSLTDSVKKAFGEKIDVQTVNISNSSVNITPLPTSQSGESSGAAQARASMNTMASGASGPRSKGFIPSFYNPLREAVQRESQYVPFSSIRVNKSNKLINQNNPLGLAVTNTIDEPNGLASIGLASKGYVPNFASKSKILDKVLKDETLYGPETSKQAQRLAKKGQLWGLDYAASDATKGNYVLYKIKPDGSLGERGMPNKGDTVLSHVAASKFLGGVKDLLPISKLAEPPKSQEASLAGGTILPTSSIDKIIRDVKKKGGSATDLQKAVETFAQQNLSTSNFLIKTGVGDLSIQSRGVFGIDSKPLGSSAYQTILNDYGRGKGKSSDFFIQEKAELSGQHNESRVHVAIDGKGNVKLVRNGTIDKTTGGNLPKGAYRRAAERAALQAAEAFVKANPKLAKNQFLGLDVGAVAATEGKRLGLTTKPFSELGQKFNPIVFEINPTSRRGSQGGSGFVSAENPFSKASPSDYSSILERLGVKTNNKLVQSNVLEALSKGVMGNDTLLGSVKNKIADTNIPFPSSFFGKVKGAFSGSSSKIKSLFQNTGAKISNLGNSVFGSVGSKFSQAGQGFSKGASDLGGRLSSGVSGVVGKIGAGASDLGGRLSSGVSGVVGKIGAGASGIAGKVKGGLGDMAAGLSGPSGRVKGGFSGGLAALGFFGNLQQSLEDSQAGRNLEKGLSGLAAASTTLAMSSGVADLVYGRQTKYKSEGVAKMDTQMRTLASKGLQAASAFSTAAESAKEFRDGNKIAGTAKAVEAAAYAASLFEGAGTALPKGAGILGSLGNVTPKGLMQSGGKAFGIGSALGLGVEIAKAKNNALAEDYSDILFGKKDEDIDPKTGEVTKSRSILGAGFDVYGTVMGAVAGGPIGQAVTAAKVGYRVGNVIENKLGIGEGLGKIYEDKINKERAGEIGAAEARLRIKKAGLKDREAFKAHIAEIEEKGKKGVEEEKIKGAKDLAEVYKGAQANKEKNDKEKIAPLRKGIIDGIIKNQESNGLVTSRDKANYLMGQEAIYGKFKPEEFADKELYKSYKAYSAEKENAMKKESALMTPKIPSSPEDTTGLIMASKKFNQADRITAFREESARQSELLASAPKDALEEAMRRGVSVEQVMEERKTKAGKSRGFIPNFSNAYNREKLDILRNPDYSGYRNAVPQPSKYYKNIVKNSAEIEVPAVEVYNRMGYFGATPKNSSEQYAILNPAQQSKLGYASGGFVPNFAAEQFAGAVSDAMQKALSPLIDKVGTSVSNSNVINVSDQRSYQTGSDRITGIMEFLYSQFPKEMGRQMGPKLV